MGNLTIIEPLYIALDLTTQSPNRYSQIIVGIYQVSKCTNQDIGRLIYQKKKKGYWQTFFSDPKTHVDIPCDVCFVFWYENEG